MYSNRSPYEGVTGEALCIKRLYYLGATKLVGKGRSIGGGYGLREVMAVMVVQAFTVADMIVVVDLMNAKKGGHGASKNKIGSRGADKVVLVPVGTVIHLVEGEIPSEVEKTSLAAVDPWDVPGELDCDLSESARHLASTVPSGTGVVQAIADCCHGSSSSLKASLVKSAKVKQATQLSSIVPFSQSSPLCDRSRVCREDHNVWREDVSELDYGSSEADIDHGSCEAEEETEEEENIQYNVAELVEPGQRIIVSRGGDGGLGNVSTGKSHRKRSKPGAEKDKGVSSEESHDDQHPSPSPGFPGSEVVLLLELKSIADVGLVGVPNAGKSTLLGAISRAKPIVGHYAFTTLRPNLGNLNYDDFSLTVADIPGLIRGAHENRGLGHAFLRHIERTKVIAYVVDLAAALDDRKGIPPWEQLRDLILELEFYREGLSGRPSLIVANKIDEAGAEEVCDELKRRVPGIPIFPVCAVLEEGIPELKDGLRRLVNGEELYRLNLDCLVLD
ncbi:hypothetical protein RJ640_003755 [Escallonia rubra]|uniref:Uncharacterized protein n=1 Tax=Escallonia rubra TaxID=112253 RepID=A0AA88UIG3_9ASTE|nr:hypothetical protein RJ640_003755 [Escallonia rubra]